METTLPSIALMACVVVALLVARSRSLVTHILVEAGLLLAVGAFLAWRGASPLPLRGSLPPGLLGMFARALAVIWWLIGARLIVNVTAFARGRDPKSRNARLFSDLAAAVIYITAGLIILNSVLDFNVNGLLVTSGVIAIVLGLALQNTLADVFSGIAVGVERPFRVGDQVSVGDGVEGVIVQINWRSLRVQTDDDDLATIPNSIVAKAPIINRSVPTRRRAGTVEIVAPAHAASDTVIELMQQAALLCPRILPLPAPSITLRRSGLHSAIYAAHIFVADSPDLTPAKSLLLRQSRRLLRHAGIGHAAPMSPTELLSSVALFETLSAEELDGLAGAFVVHNVEPRDTVFEQGMASTSLYVIDAGVFETSRLTPSGREEALGRLGVGEHIGELGLMSGAPRAFTLRALTRGRVLELRGNALADLLQSNLGLHAAMKRSAQHGRASIERADAAHLQHPSQPSSTLLARARAFLGF